MIKKHLKTIIITSVIIFTPMIVGLVLWDKLPDMIPSHFGVNNQPDSYNSKTFMVFGFPLLLLALHLFCIFATKFDPKAKNYSDKVFTLVLYIIPAISLLMCAIIYPFSLGKEIRVGLIVILFMGLLFTVTGNYLPKCKQTYTVGIKLPWTLDNTDNWNKTHSLAGKLWVCGGILIIATAFLENPFIFFGILLVMVIVPTVYSYLLYKKNKDKTE